jgi:cell wall-associated NlpC family hydrolase
VPVKGVYLAGTGIGAIMLYAGFKGKKWTDVTHSLISGKSPTDTQAAYPITTSPVAFQQGSGSFAYGGYSIGTGGTASGEAIAQDALKYQGASYVWAGAPGSGAGHWDCSSFVNAVVGRDLGMAIPMYGAGKYIGQAHGPNTLIWLAWPGAKRTSTPEPGTLVIWQTHMGICLGGTKMISALNGQLGTQVTTIAAAAPPGEIRTFKNLVAAGG